MVTVHELRQTLSLAAERPDGVRDVLAIACPARPVTAQAVAGRVLALGDWPELWRIEPACGPAILVTLSGDIAPYLITGVFRTDPAQWRPDESADPQRWRVPACWPYAQGAVLLDDRHALAGVRFGWPDPEERFAFL
jgi:hypothetical protein